MTSTTEQQGVFLGIPPEFTDPATSAAAILPVPYDETSTWMKGADRGPSAIIDASTAVELFDIETGTEPYRHGIATRPAVDFKGPPDQLADLVETAVAGLIEQGQLPVVLGGEHSVSIGAIRAAAARTAGRRLTVLQIDAHGDTREEYEGSPFNHACVMARAREVADIVQVGIRAIDVEELDGLDRRRVFFAHEIVGNPDRSWMEQVIELLTNDVYITIDLDAFDPSIIPATGTPEPGGLGWYEVTELLDRVAKAKRIVGFDVVELLPMSGHHASAFAAAKLVYRLLAMVLRER